MTSSEGSCGCVKESTDYVACGNCKFFVAGGKCQRVRGEIEALQLCDLWVKGQPQELGNDGLPTFEKSNTNYRPATMIYDWPPNVIGMDRLAQNIPEIKLELKYPPDPLPSHSSVHTEPYPTDTRMHDPREPYLSEPYARPSQIQEAQWDEAKHPRGKGGQFASKEGDGVPATDYEQALKQMERDRDTIITAGMNQGEKQRLIDLARQRYGDVGTYVGGDEFLTDQNVVEYHNKRATLRHAKEAVDARFAADKQFMRDIYAQQREVRQKQINIDPEGKHRNNIATAKTHFEIHQEAAEANHYLDKHETWQDYMKEKHPDAWAELPVGMTKFEGELEGLEKQMNDYNMGYRSQQTEDDVEDLNWMLANQKMSSVEGHNFFIEDAVMQNKFTSQLVKSVKAMKGNWKSEDGISPSVNFKLYEKESDHTFTMGGSIYRRLGSWDKQSNTIDTYNVAKTKQSIYHTMTHELAHAQYDNLKPSAAVMDAHGDFVRELTKISQSKRKSEEFGWYFAKYAGARRSAKVRKRTGRRAGHSSHLETEMFAALAEHQMLEERGGKPYPDETIDVGGGQKTTIQYDNKYDRLHRDHPKLMKAFETLRGIKGTQFEQQ